MDERMEEVLKRYDMQVYRTYRARGAFVLETDKGLRLYKSYTCSAQRAKYEYDIQTYLVSQGFPFVDRYIPNENGELLTEDGSGSRYIIKQWYSGEECNLYSENEAVQAVTALAELHGKLSCCGIRIPQERQGTDIWQDYERHLREMKRVKSYIRGKKDKNAFEICFLNHFDRFYGQGTDAFDRMREINIAGIFAEAAECGDVFHGNYTYHHLLMTKDGVAVVQFEKAGTGSQVQDLCFFLRKVLEKNQWNVALGERLIEEYNSKKPLSSTEWELLFAMLYFPEKFWKIANAYYNSKKSRVPGRNMQKLNDFLVQADKRDEFLKLAGAQTSILKTAML